MDSEKEKKEKLVAARKKLNQYKLNRGAGGKTSPVPEASSKPADVPLFYQGLNTPTTAFNLFNPAAAADNNNQAPTTASYFNPTLPSSTVIASTADNLSRFDSQADQNYSNVLNTTSTTPFNVFNPATVNNNEAPTTSTYFDTTLLSSSEPIVKAAGDNFSTDQNQANTILNNNQNLPDFTHQQFVPLITNRQTPPIVDYPAPVNPESAPFFQHVTDERNNQFGLQTDVLQSEFLYSPGVGSSSTLTSLPMPHTNQDVRQDSTSEELPKSTGNDNILLEYVNLEASQNDHLPSAPPFAVNKPSVFPGVNNADNMGTAELLKVSEGITNSGGSVPIEKRDSQESYNLTNNEGNLQDTSTQFFASSLFSSSEKGPSTNSDQVFNLGDNKSLIDPLVASVSEFSSDNEHTSTSHDSKPERAHSPVLNALLQQAVAPVETLVSENMIPIPLPVNNIEDKTEQFGESSFTSNVGSLSVMPSDIGSLLNSAIVEPHKDSSYFGDQEPNSTENLKSSNSVEDSTPCNLANTITESNSPLLNPVQNENLYTSSQPVVENSKGSEEVVSQLKSVQEALELQIEELRRENEYLLGRQTELTSKIEESEKLAHDFKLERDRIKEEAMGTSQALRARINSLCEENQRIVKNSTEVGVDLRAVLEEKSKQLEEMQNAVIVVSQSKMEFAARLDHELERVKELENIIVQKDAEISALRNENTTLQENLKLEQQKDAVINQLKDQTRHYQVQTETLQKETTFLRRRVKELQDSVVPVTQQVKESTSEEDQNHQHSDGEEQKMTTVEHKSCTHDHNHDQDQDHHHHDEDIGSGHHNSHDNHEHPHHHPHEDHEHHHHSHEDHEHHQHSHADHDHNHGHHNHEHDNHGGHHHNDEGEVGVVARLGPIDEMAELKKTLHRLQWENSTFKSDLEVLAVDAKDKRTFEEKCAALEEENTNLKEMVARLEHVIIQLQGENDTIGDYITLYQTQKLALKECAKEKDAQLELLAREREMLLHRLAELTALVKELKESKSEAGSQCADDHMHNLDAPFPAASGNNKRQIEGKIRDLLTEIGSSTLIENFHPCALCSGRLMTV